MKASAASSQRLPVLAIIALVALDGIVALYAGGLVFFGIIGFFDADPRYTFGAALVLALIAVAWNALIFLMGKKVADPRLRAWAVWLMIAVMAYVLYLPQKR